MKRGHGPGTLKRESKTPAGKKPAALPADARPMERRLRIFATAPGGLLAVMLTVAA